MWSTPPMKNCNTSPRFLPVSLRIEGKRILLIGGGKVALHKAAILARFTNCVTIVAPDFLPEFEALPFLRLAKPFDPTDLDGIFLTYICTGDAGLNRTIKAHCERLGIFASVCDDVALCDFISPAIYQEGFMTVAVSSDGRDVRRSIRLRDTIKQFFSKSFIAVQPLKK
jgi:precorrin-2 dehydrogenase/sirohydrochlorin ferrochelatase